MRVINFIAVVMLALWMTSCSSLHSKVANDLKIGDSVTKVKDVLGEPDAFDKSTLYYASKGSECFVELDEKEKVSNLKCDSSNYKNAGQRTLGFFGALMQGAGNGIKNGSQNRRTCTSNTYGTTTYTDCQ